MTIKLTVFYVAGKYFPHSHPTVFVNPAVDESNKNNHTFSPILPNAMCTIALNNNVIPSDFLKCISSFLIWSVYTAHTGSRAP